MKASMGFISRDGHASVFAVITLLAMSTVQDLMMLRTGWGVTPGFGMIGIKSMNYRSSHAASSPSSWSRHCSPYIALCVFIVCWLGAYIRHLSTLHQTRSMIFPKVCSDLQVSFRKDRPSFSQSSDEVSRLLSKNLNESQCSVWPCLPGGRTFVYPVCGSTLSLLILSKSWDPAIWKSNINQQWYNTGDMSHHHRPLIGGAVTNWLDWPWAWSGHFLNFGGESSACVLLTSSADWHEFSFARIQLICFFVL